MAGLDVLLATVLEITDEHAARVAWAVDELAEDPRCRAALVARGPDGRTTVIVVTQTPEALDLSHLSGLVPGVSLERLELVESVSFWR